MTLNITLAIIPVLCMNCTINQNAFPSGLNETLPSIDELSTFLEGLPAILTALHSPAVPLVPEVPPNPAPAPPVYPTTPEELLLADLGQPPVRRQLPSKVKAMPPATAVFTIPLNFRQDTSTTHGIMSTITSMIAGMMPFNRHHPESTPVDAPPTHKHQEQEKAAHLHQEHVNEPAESLPDGVVSGGFYHKGEKANGEYFNEEFPSAEALEVHQSQEQGKLYDENSVHPYYVVDKPVEGPAHSPLVYFSSGLRNGESASSQEAWTNYYARLKEYNDYYSSYTRSGRSINEKRNRGSYESLTQLTNQVSLPGKSSSTKSDR